MQKNLTLNALWSSEMKEELNFGFKLKNNLPVICQRIIERCESEQEAEMMTLGALTTLSAAMPNVHGVYGNRKVFPNLFLFVCAPASAGKGRLNLCKELIKPIHKELRGGFDTQIELLKMLTAEGDREMMPESLNMGHKGLLIPANSSATAIYQSLHENGGNGLIFETEGDTLANTIRSSYGNFSDGLRKAFHHEEISYRRRKGNEWVQVENPRLSVVLSGTPRQLRNLIPSTENGLFSRFMMVQPKLDMVWRDMIAGACADGLSDDDCFAAIGLDFLKLYKKLENRGGAINFRMTEKQAKRFNDFFEDKQLNVCSVIGDEMVATVRRMGLIMYRLAMILSVLRLEETEVMELPDVVVCRDVDFESAYAMAKFLIMHAIEIFMSMPEGGVTYLNKTEQRNGVMMRLLEDMPEVFTRMNATEWGNESGLCNSSMDKYLRVLVMNNKIKRLKNGVFEKVA